MSSMQGLDVTAEAAPVQEAASIPKVQRVLVLYRTDLGDKDNDARCVADHYEFLRFLIDKGFTYTVPDSSNHGIVYERVQPE